MASRKRGPDELLIQEALFVDHYLACNCNGTEAARRAGYSATSSDGLASTATRLLNRVQVQRALDKKRKAIEMGATEVIARHSEIARASLEDVCDPMLYPELAHARASGKVHLLKRLTVTTRTIPTKQGPITERNVTFELHDSAGAQRTMMKYHGLLTDVIAVKDLPKDEDGLVAVVMREIQRVTGSAPEPGKKVKA